ncbi:MAG: glycosyltransferase family 39 protein [Actinobacteria bacterium]|nr:glycosyltransferase family 39 protein [Actinomycetota bacterium]MCB8998239.1 glycosyltransferase family 39 protein [Actinomycetota bacterium]HRY08961.1 glycosyltransferase family 39 protein [Candidatus Nanopelagicales bacterium]
MATGSTEATASTRVPATRGWKPHRPLLLALLGYLLVRGTVMLNGYLYADDFALRYWADTSGLTPEYLFRSYYGHVQPWGLLAQWILQAGWPGSWTALMVWSLAMQVAILALLWRIVLRLTGSQVAALLAFLVPAVSSFTFEVGVWWCMIIESAPYGLFMMLSIWWLIRALSGDPGRWWLWSGLAFGAAVLSISKGSLFIIAMVVIAAFLPIGVERARGLRGAFRANPRYWVLLVGFTAAYAVFLRIHAPISRDPDWNLLRALRYSRDLFLLNIVNGSAGGPWRWFSAQGETWNGVLVIPLRTTGLMVIAVVLLIAVFVVVRRYRPVLFPYLWGMLVYALALTALAAYGRGGSLVASTGYRYTSDFWILLALFAGLLFYPTVWETQPFSAKAQALGRRLRARGIRRRTVALSAAVAFLVSSLISAVEPSLRWVNSQTKDYVTTARNSMPAIPANAEFLPQRTMTDLVHPMLMLPYASTEVVFSPDPAFRPFVDYSTDGLFGFANDGSAQQQFVAGTPSQPNGVCGYRISTAPLVIPMTREVPQWTFVAQVSYLSDADTTVRMRIGPNDHEVPIRQGLHNVFFEVEGPVPDVTVTGTDVGVQTCIDLISIGPRLGPDSQEPFYPPPEWPQ